MGQSRSRKMIEVVLITTSAIFLMSQLSFGIQVQKKQKQSQKTLPSFPTALSFSVDNNIMNNSFGGVSISAARKYSKHHGFKVNFSFGHALRDYYNDDNLFYQDGEYLNDFEVTNRSEIRLSLLHLTYPSYNRRFNFYWGAGPIVTLQYTATDYYESFHDVYYPYHEIPTRVYDDESRETYQSISLGGIGTAGMELFLTSNFSIQAEYELTLQHEWSEFRGDEIYNGEPVYVNMKTRDQHNFSTSQFKLGVSYHY